MSLRTPRRTWYNGRDMGSFYVLDGMALIYRAFYAFINAPMRTAAGLNTSAVFGFLNTVCAIIDKEKPTHIVACMDPSGPTFRHERYPAYKATRQAMPEELRASIPLILELLEALRIRTVRLDGFEADDLIGTFTRIADERGDMETYMVSKDKDLGQLLSPRCHFLKPGKKGSDFERVSCEQFLEEWGIDTPQQTIDILSLMGDTADNIPGVPGIGEVTARKLIRQFGSLNNLLEHTAEVKGKMRQKIEENSEQARLSYELAVIRRDVPLPCSIDDCKKQDFDIPRLRELLTRLEFKNLITRLCDKEAPAPTATARPAATVDEAVQPDLFSTAPLRSMADTPHSYTAITTLEARLALAERLMQSDHWAFDTETTGLDPMTDKLLGVSFCLQAHEAFYVPISEPEDLKPFRPAFAGPAEKVGLNLKFDLRVLRQAGVEVSGPFFDAMLAHSAVYPNLRHNMDDIAETLLGYRTVHLEEIAGKDANTASVPLAAMTDYAAEDADITLQLADALRPKLEEAGQAELMRDIEFPLLPVLADIESEGMRVDPQQLELASAEMGKQLEEVRERIDAIVGHPINLNSPRQLGELLFDELKLLTKPKKTRTGQYVTDEETLRKLVPISPLVGDILEHRELVKLKGTYLDALPKFISPADGRIHAQLLQMVTATGRLACQSPNLQNIPIRSEAGKLIRRAFVPRDDNFRILSADYSQVELRVMAALCGDPAFVSAFRSGRDIHAETAALLYGVPREEVTADMRRKAKTVNFGIIYGISSFGLSQRLDCTRGEAAALIENYFAQFPGVKSYMDRLVIDARERGYAETMAGRRRYLPDLENRNFNLRAAAERTAINTPIQGTAADIIKLAMVRVARLLKGRKSRLIMQIHDELLVDLHRDEAEELPALICREMTDAFALPNGVPLLVESNVADNWLDAH